MAPAVQFTLNGELQSVPLDDTVGRTLNEYIRFNTKYTGTKVSCAQGGCGACTVALARPSQPLKSIVSCLTPLTAVHGAAVVTVEGLASATGEPHPVAERLAKFGGSQCGFCTPGMVMQMFSTLSQQDGGKACTAKGLEQCLNGNICRCTGYRPIVECVKSFAVETEVKNQIDPEVSVGPYDTAAADPRLVFPKEVVPIAGKQWLQVTSIDDAKRAVQDGATPIAGGTAAGIYPDLAVASAAAAGRVWVDISAVQELSAITLEGDMLRINATVTWSGFTEYLRALAASSASNAKSLNELADRCGSIAGSQVRNAGTIGGNVAISRNRDFLSDWVPPLAALGATVIGCRTADGDFEEDLLSFVSSTEVFDGLILAVKMPLPASDLVFKSFRVAKRGRNAHALANAAFVASTANDRLSQLTLILGAVGPKPLRLKGVERALSGMTAQGLKANLPSTLSAVSEKVSADLFPLDFASGREQTEHIVCGFVVKFLAAALGAALPKDWASAEYCLHDMERSTSTLQAFPAPVDLQGELNKPLPKTTALEQTTGRAKFTDDLPRPTGTLLGALVVCPEANAIVDEIDCKPAREMLGARFHSLVTAADLKKVRLDSSKLMGFGDLPPELAEDVEPESLLLLPAGEASKFGGQPVAVLLAAGECPRLVEQAAAALSEQLTLRRAGYPLIGDLRSCPPATASPITFTRGTRPVQDVLAAALAPTEPCALVQVSGEFEKKSQAHFYLEGQSVLVVPDEDGIQCYCACQGNSTVQKAICEVTGLQQSKVAVIFRRVGGGFGGKMVYPAFLAALASDIAYTRKLPVRMVLPRETDMSVVGGRQEMEGTWQAAVDAATGRIAALDYTVYLAHSVAGKNMQRFTSHAIGGAIDMCYAIPDMAVTVHQSMQHLVERTAVRAPGHLEAMLLMEAVLDGISASLRIPGHIVREANLCTGSANMSGLNGAMLPTGSMSDYSTRALWSWLKERSSYEARAKAVADFNEANAWKKRGISMAPARYGVFNMPGSLARVDIFADGSVQVAVSGAEIGQGLHTKVGQMINTVMARHLGAGPPLESIRFLDTSTEQNPNGPPTGGSTTSEGNMFAAGDAALQLVERLKHFVEPAKKIGEESDSRTGEESGDALWFNIIKACYSGKIMGMMSKPQNLSAIGMHFGALADMMYETYGVAAAEVELDVLTGESRVLFAHLAFDIGMSYNPMVDIGQMEGAFMMGLGQVMYEGMEYDHSTGRVLTNNTWTYKPPIACDVPEDFRVELVDMTKERHNGIGHTLWGIMSSVMGWVGYPWRPTPTETVLKSAKAIGEPPALLCAAPHSALAAAVVAALGGPLPDNKLPIPAKPFVILPMLQSKKPGSGNAADDVSTATGTSVGTTL